MHVVIAWWDGTRGAASDTARTDRSGAAGFGPEAAASLAAAYPGLRSGQWIDEPVAGREGLALIWDCADSADLFLPVISERTFGCPLRTGGPSNWTTRRAPPETPTCDRPNWSCCCAPEALTPERRAALRLPRPRATPAPGARSGAQPRSRRRRGKSARRPLTRTGRRPFRVSGAARPS